MGLIDIYLQKNGKKRSDVCNETGMNHRMITSENKKNVRTYSVKTIQAIAKAVNKSEGLVIDELLKLESEKAIFEVYNTEDLLLALNHKEPYIAIKGEYKAEMEEFAKSQLSETETLGVELGSAGLLNILAEGFYQLTNLFSNKDDKKKKIESQLRKYKIKKVNENEFLLYLRQIDY